MDRTWKPFEGWQRFERSVLLEYTRIESRQTTSELIKSSQYCVDRHGNALYVGVEAAPIAWGMRERESMVVVSDHLPIAC
jgi:hypothetical protein